ncbi:DUF2147 domain-containing protein [Pedobacter sp. Hv1]|uniref:DUF2147 domain-containing protein n=1 Tax=Pedobacter sp. Hv1 TaxID=1740090 RepID=UPI0006D89CA2|nr:DUF2147 domain-containing protein [Pedobacter sp. Hv1]KQC01765.1 SIGNAL peptide protein [Pedobacter sp. Hv1]
MSKKLSLLLVFAICTLSVFAQKKDDVLGKWVNPSGEGQIEIYKKGDKYFGKLAWIKEPNDEKGKPKTDLKNPNADLRSKPILGLEILKDFVFEDGKWTDGTIYDPKTGKTYSCNLNIKNDGQLNIRGYVGISLIGRSESWKRAK